MQEELGDPATGLGDREKYNRVLSELRAAKEEVSKGREMIAEQASELARLKEESGEKLERARETIAKASAQAKSNSELWKIASKYYSLFWQGILADEALKSDADLGADVYLSLLPSTVPAARSLQRLHGGRVICDCVENVEVERQSLAPKISPVTLDMINLAGYGALSSVDGLMTVSHEVGKTLQRFGPPVRVQPNYRRFETPPRSGLLRRKFGIPDNARVLVATGGIVGGFEDVVEAMTLLPEDVHLVAFVKISPPEYADRIASLVEELGLGGRVHIAGFVPYEELSSLIADADAGLVVLDTGNPNHLVSLPNRIFDFTTSGTAFVTPDLPEISRFVEEHRCGVVLSDTSAAAWAQAILSLLVDLDRYRAAILQARQEATWESTEDDLVEYLGNPTSVTMIGFRDLSRYQRFLRIARTLTARGIKVKAVFFSNSPLPVSLENTEFYYFSDRYGRGPGLSRVPYSATEAL